MTPNMFVGVNVLLVATGVVAADAAVVVAASDAATAAADAAAAGGLAATAGSVATVVGGVVMALTGLVSITYAAIGKFQDVRVKRFQEEVEEIRGLLKSKDEAMDSREAFWKGQELVHQQERAALGGQMRRLEDRIASLEGEKVALVESLTTTMARLMASMERLLQLSGQYTDALPPVPIPGVDATAVLLDGPAMSLKVLLIVEDNDLVRQTLADLMPLYAPNKFRVEQAVNVREGLAKLETDPDAILLDLMLPDGDGVEILKAVRSRGMKAKVYVMTGRHSDSLGYLAEYHPDGLFQKPTPAATVIRTVLVGLGR